MITIIFNATQHPATVEQKEAGVVDANPLVRERLAELLTFDERPTSNDLQARATVVAQLVKEASQGARLVMIGGAPFFMSPLEAALLLQGLEPVYAFSRRESVEETQADGSVRKITVFRHLGFVPASW